MKSNKLSVLLAVLALIAASLACSTGELSLENPRMAFDSDGNNVTTTFSPSDVFYAVADLNNAPVGTVVNSKWYAVSVEGMGANEMFYEQSLNNDTEGFTGTIYFQLSNDSPWPAGSYKVELYLNSALMHTVAFSVQ